MKEYIEERDVEIGKYIVDYHATVRQTAKRFGISKSTVHKDATERLPEINPFLAQEAREILDINKSERHIRGGLATKLKNEELYLALGWLAREGKLTFTESKADTIVALA